MNVTDNSFERQWAERVKAGYCGACGKNASAVGLELCQFCEDLWADEMADEEDWYGD